MIIVRCENDSVWFSNFRRKPMHPKLHVRTPWLCTDSLILRLLLVVLKQKFKDEAGWYSLNKV